MGFREVAVTEIREVLRAWLAGAGLRRVAEQAGVDRKTARRYVEAAVAAGLARAGGPGQLSDELIGMVAQAVRPVRPSGHGQAWDQLEACQQQVETWVKKDGLTVVKIGVMLQRRGVVVPYRTLHRFCAERCGFGPTASTVRVADGEPGKECQLDFGYLGMMADPVTGRRRKVHALIFTACYSRHMFVWLSFSQTLAAFIAGCEAAWAFFGGVFPVLIPDNASPIVADADAVNPRFTAGWLDYAQHCGFATDAARVRSPKDKPKVERNVQYVRGNFWAGEDFADLGDAQARARAWCADVAGMRIHGTTCARPAEVFAGQEAGLLLPVPAAYDVPVFTAVKVHRDFHVEVARSLYSAPQAYRGRYLDARADSALVKLYHRGQLVKVHPRQLPGRRVTDPADLPEHKTTYAMRDVEHLAAAARGHGEHIGVYAGRLLEGDLPWTKMRQAYRLLGLVRRYGPGPVDRACARALELDVVNVTKIASMLEKATENAPLPPPPAVAAAGRFVRDPAEYRPVQLTLLDSGKENGR
ncbi:MAG: IS21 family transposase [Actinobacteria bacterium]|nr:IS21 family transposase [Actinomycetota bacterium]MBO0832371.1 IS21 family transposase [Actinomycetota bacterium]